ncbi:MAG: hypothetical protein L6R42_008254 [Xanthoria sp. 1 TBL-2021]|nr:MAG: hypothetical protein L6R42_008254 [Xanthoria sp. 1 TBL-2021]
MKQLGQKKTIAKDAIEAFNMPEVKRNPAQAGLCTIYHLGMRTKILQDGRFNNLGHLGIQLPQTTWNPEGTHLEPTPSYATNALIYSASDMGLLQQRLFRAESEVLMREEACRVCGLTFLKRSGGKDLDRTTEINNHYASHVMAGPRACSMKGCEEDLGNPNKYSTWAQLTEHLELHPDTSSLRNQVAEAPSTLRRESATQTNPIDLDPNFRYEPQIEDSLTERPIGDVRLWCGICNSYLDDLTQKSIMRSKIPFEDLTPMEFNKSFKVVSGNPITTLKSRYKPTTRRIVQGGTTSMVEATTTITATLDQLASTTALGRGKRNAATSKTPNEVMSSNLPAETANQTAPAKGGKGKKAQTDTKAARAATATQPDSTETSAIATPKTSESSSGKLPRKRAPTAKAKIRDDPDDPADPPNPARKTRARQTKLENEPATTTEDPQPESSKQIRASRAKKTNNQAEGTGQSQASSSVPADTPGSSLHPPAPEEKTADNPETTETKTLNTRGTRARRTTTTQATTITTSPRKRRTPATKTATETPPTKRCKTAKEPENAAETKFTVPTGAEDTAIPSLDPPAHGANNNDDNNDGNDQANSTPAKGKRKTPAPKSKAKPPTHKTPAPKPPTTRSSPRKRDNSATTTEEPTTGPPPVERRKVETSEGGVVAQPSAAADGDAVPSVEQAGAVAAGVADGDGDGDGKVEGEGGDGGGAGEGEGDVEGEGEGEQTASSSTNKRKRTPTPKAAAAAAADEAEGKKGGK